MGQFVAIQTVAPSLGMEVIPLAMRDASEIERAVASFARTLNGGLIVTGGRALDHRELIINLAARHKLPAVYLYRVYITDGGLISYGPNLIENYRLAAGYVDRISGARSRPICPYRRQPSTKRCSTSRPPRRSVWTYQRLCSPAPTR